VVGLPLLHVGGVGFFHAGRALELEPEPLDRVLAVQTGSGLKRRAARFSLVS